MTRTARARQQRLPDHALRPGAGLPPGSAAPAVRPVPRSSAVADRRARRVQPGPGRVPDRAGTGRRRGRPGTRTAPASCGSARPKPCAAGAAFTVEVRYIGSPSPVRSHWGELGWEELDDGALVASQPIGAPSWFPCNDRPADKASYRIAVTTPARVHGGRQRQAARPATTARPAPPPGCTSSRRRCRATSPTVQIGRYRAARTSADGPIPQRAAVPSRLLVPSSAVTSPGSPT